MTKCRDDELRKFERNKFLPAYLLLGLFVMEVLRFCCSTVLQRARHRRKYAYQSLHTLRDLDDELIGVKREQVRRSGFCTVVVVFGTVVVVETVDAQACRSWLQEISSKYAHLKDKYRKKYAAPEVIAITSTRETTSGPLYV